MRLRELAIVGAVVLALCLAGTASAAARKDANAEVLKRLDEMQKALQSQQELLQRQAAEIETLKGQLGQQKQATTENKAKIEQVAQAKPKVTTKDILGDRFKFSTDLRLRWEDEFGRKQSGKDIEDRNRFRIRWRIFLDAKATDEFSLHGMLTTSSGSWFSSGSNSRNWQPGRTSNQTLDDEMNNKNIYIGRIYGSYEPKWMPGLEITGGKFKNTFMHTDIMWDPDVNPEGIYERYQFKGWKIVQPFVHFGQMVASENNTAEDATLLLWQAGAEVNLPAGIKWAVAGSYYDWNNLNKSDMSKVEGNSSGNSVDKNGLYVYDYKLLQGITYLDFKLASLPARLYFDYINNQASDVKKGTAWAAGFKLGQNKKKGDWSLFFKYAEIEADAVVANLADGDFWGSNRKGWKGQAIYTLLDPIDASLSFFQTDVMDGAENYENRMQLDLTYRFTL